MKKRIVIAFALILIVVFGLSCLTSCATLTAEEGYEALLKAVIATEKAQIYKYTLHTNATAKATTKVTRSVNLWSETDPDGNIIFDANGVPTDYKLYMSYSDGADATAAKESVCGVAFSEDKSTSKKIFREWTYHKEDEGVSSERSPSVEKEITTKEYIESAEFAPYSLTAQIDEIANMPFDAFDFDFKAGFLGDNGGVERTGYVTNLIFKVKQEYIDKYELDNGKPSMFKGHSYAKIELSAYGEGDAQTNKLTNITVFQANTDSSIGFDFERFMLQVIYLGPKISIPDLQYEKQAN